MQLHNRFSSIHMLELIAVAVPVPLYTLFDYRVPATGGVLVPGMRVRVPFGRRTVVGVVVRAPREEAVDAARYKRIAEVLDAEPVFPAELQALCGWAADYYQHPPGEVFDAALPGPLRRGGPASIARAMALQCTVQGRAALPDLPPRSTAMRALLSALATPLTRAQLLQLQPKAGAALKKALAQGWVVAIELKALEPAAPAAALPSATGEQAAALEQLAGATGFGISLLEGVTGSGKTEVYLRLIAQVLQRGGQALVLAPEIGLTPQLLERFAQRFGARVASFHSGLGEKERADVWLRARAGEVQVVIGTRSAIFVPFARLELIVVDEEHDTSYKQQDGFRYCARDLAIVRAQRLGAPVLLGSATPSLETLHNAQQGRYRHLKLAQRVTSAAPPRVQLIDMRGRKLDHGVSPALFEAVQRHLEAGGQALLFINRRGYAPVLLCHDCGWSAPCSHCDAHMTLHRGRGRLICHHCGAQQAAPKSCPSCGAAQLVPVGQGTERIEDALRNRFPRHRVERFDSDRLRRAGELERLLADIKSGAIHILVGTQVLAKGHDFAGLTLVGIVSADQALYGSDFRAIERMGQLVTQVAGRAGRADQPGEVFLQTHEPEHPLLQTLIKGGYGALSQAVLEERRLTGLPPYSHLALLRAESEQAAAPLRFLQQARALLPARGPVSPGEPVPAVMEQRAGRTRAQLLLQSGSRPALQKALSAWVAQLDRLPDARRVRWSLDVDPYDLF